MQGGERFFYILFAFHNYYKFRFCLDLETVWRPEGTALPAGGEGEAKQILRGSPGTGGGSDRAGAQRGARRRARPYGKKGGTSLGRWDGTDSRLGAEIAGQLRDSEKDKFVIYCAERCWHARLGPSV